MLWSEVNRCWNGILLLMTVVMVCAIYAYSVNSRRPDDDPKKKNYHLLAIFLAPITLPLLVVFSVSIFILRVVTYSVFLVIFIFALILIRKPFILEQLRKTVTFIGDRLLEANTFLIRLFLHQFPGGESA